MNLLDEIKIAKKIIVARIFKKRMPLVVSWLLTFKCNLECLYCGLRKNISRELDLVHIFSLIDELESLGTKCIIFGGGEVLLKPEIEKILNYCSSKNIYIVMNSNGLLIREKLKAISQIDRIQLSLDGPESIHDFVRGQKGVYSTVLEAIEICKGKNIKINITTVISKYNLTSCLHLLKIAKQFKVGVYFQPATKHLLGDIRKNIIAPPIKEYRETIKNLIKEKIRGNRFILNTVYGLKYLYYWPGPKRIFCLAKLLHCHIEPDGRIFICDRFPNYQQFLVSTNRSFREAFNNLSLAFPCHECWCGSMVEFNLAGNCNFNALVSMWKSIH